MQPEMVEPKYKPRQAVCPEPRSHQDPNHLSSLSSWPRAMCAGIWRALVGTCLALVYLGVCGIGTWQATGAGHPHHTRSSHTPWHMGYFQQEFHCTQYFAQEHSEKEFGSRERQQRGPRPVEPENVHRLQSWAAAVTFWMGLWTWGNPNLPLRQEASEKLIRVPRDNVRELKKEAKPKTCAQRLICGLPILGSAWEGFFKCRYSCPTQDLLHQGFPLLGLEVWIFRNLPR